MTKRYSPNLIDLVQYEKDLLYQREHRIDLRPVPAIPNFDWSDSEMQAMRDNRKVAQEIYERIAAPRPVDDIQRENARTYVGDNTK